MKLRKDSFITGIKLHYLYPEPYCQAIQEVSSFQMSYPQPTEESPYTPLALNMEVERQSSTEPELGAVRVNHLHTMLLHTRTPFGGFTRAIVALQKDERMLSSVS